MALSESVAQTEQSRHRHPLEQSFTLSQVSASLGHSACTLRNIETDQH